MNPVTIWLSKVGIKIAKALFKKQYKISKEKEDAKRDNSPAVKPDAGKL